jgi:hypothetical protein
MSAHQANEIVYRSGPMTSSASSFSLTLDPGGGGLGTGSTSAADKAASTTSSSSDSNAVMNEKVQAMAGAIYEEFESMMTRYDADVVKNLMPLVINVLESMDLGSTECQEMEVEVELLKEDNEQLVTQYEREKGLRKSSEQRLIEVEDAGEGERKEAEMKVESLTSIVKMFELKAKNSQEQSEFKCEMRKSSRAGNFKRFSFIFQFHAWTRRRPR